MSTVGRPRYLEAKTITALLRCSSAVVLRYLRDKSIPDKQKVHVAIAITQRQIPIVTEEIGNTAKNIIFNVNKNHVPKKECGVDATTDANIRPQLHSEADNSSGND